MSKQVAADFGRCRFFGDDIPVATSEKVVRVVDELAIPELVGSLSIRRLDGGGSNQNFVIDSDAGCFVLRIAGDMTERFGQNREVGIAGHRHAAAVGVAPRLCGVVMPQAHLVVPFVEGRTLDSHVLAEPGVLEQCVSALSLLHYAEPVDGIYSIFEDNRRYLAIAEAENLELPVDLDKLMACSDKVEELFVNIAVPTVLGHNDLQLQNCVVTDERTWLLDYEYAAMGNPYLDLSMLLHYGDVPSTRCHDALTGYFGVVRETDLARLELMYLPATLRDAIWSLVADPVNTETGFDYSAWAERFFTRAREHVASKRFRAAYTNARPTAHDEQTFVQARQLANVRTTHRSI